MKPFTAEKLSEVLKKAVEAFEEFKKQGVRQGEEGRIKRFWSGREAFPRLWREQYCLCGVVQPEVTLHTVNGDLEYYGKLTELSEQVGDGFYRTHRAYLVIWIMWRSTTDDDLAEQGRRRCRRSSLPDS